MKINKELLPIKGFNFFFHASSSPITPNIPIIAKDIGFSTTGIGTMLMTIPLLSLVAKPFFGGLADKFSLHKAIFISMITVCGASLFATQWFTHAPVDRTVTLECNDNIQQIVIQRDKLAEDCYKERLLASINGTTYTCEKSKGLTMGVKPRNNFSTSDSCWLAPGPNGVPCELFCQDLTMYKLITKPAIDSGITLNRNQFFFAFLFIIARTCISSGYTFCDTICMKKLGDRSQDFGFNRSFGAAGYGFIALTGGILVDWFSQGKYDTDYTVTYYLSIVLSALALLCAFTLKYENEPKKPSLLADVRGALLQEPRYILFVMVSVFCGAFQGFVNSFIMWYVEDIAMEDPCAEGGWIKTLEGLILFVHCYIGEIGFFLLAGWMIKRLGHANCLSLVVFVFGLRFILISIVPNPWWLLLVESLNGITYATYTATAASYANVVAPSGTKATIQGISAGTYDVGTCLGTLFGGLAIDKWGGRACFFGVGVCGLGLGVVYSGLRTLLTKISPKKERNTISPVK